LKVETLFNYNQTLNIYVVHQIISQYFVCYGRLINYDRYITEFYRTSGSISFI